MLEAEFGYLVVFIIIISWLKIKLHFIHNFCHCSSYIFTYGFPVYIFPMDFTQTFICLAYLPSNQESYLFSIIFSKYCVFGNSAALNIYSGLYLCKSQIICYLCAQLSVQNSASDRQTDRQTSIFFIIDYESCFTFLNLYVTIFLPLFKKHINVYNHCDSGCLKIE